MRGFPWRGAAAGVGGFRSAVGKVAGVVAGALVVFSLGACASGTYEVRAVDKPVPVGPGAHERDVADAYAAFRAALRQGDGEVAAAHLTHATLDRYRTIGTMAVAGDRAALADVPAIDRYLVAALRAAGADGLRGASGHEVVVMLVGHGLLRATEAGDGAPGAVEVRGDHATAAIAPGSHVRWEFRREDGRWRLDLLPELAVGSAILESVANGRGTTVEALIEELLSEEMGRPVGPSVWRADG